MKPYGEVLYKPFEVSHTEKELSNLLDLISSSTEEIASNGIPTLFSTMQSTKMLIMEAVESLYHVDTTLANILSQMTKLASSLNEYNIVLAMPGVGNVLTPRIIAEIGDVTRFHRLLLVLSLRLSVVLLSKNFTWKSM